MTFTLLARWRTLRRMNEPGLIEKVLVKPFVREAEVLACDMTTPGFVCVTLGGKALEGVGWCAGDKVQVQLGGWAWRTYTPILWDPSAGQAQLLVYLHGDARGASWARALAPGQACAFFGPRRSLELDRLDTAALIFGDETSFATAAALMTTRPHFARSPDVSYVFEVTSEARARPVLDRLGLRHVTLVERLPDDAHLGQVSTYLESKLGDPTRGPGIVLSGKASSIQTLTRALRTRGVSRSRIMSKAYWAPGKKGLD